MTYTKKYLRSNMKNRMQSLVNATGFSTGQHPLVETTLNRFYTDTFIFYDVFDYFCFI